MSRSPGVACPDAAVEITNDASRLDRHLGLSLLWISLLLGAVVRVWLAIHDDGMAWPDEIYQSLEQAHRLVFRYGLIPWEFVDGARHWTLAGFVAVWLKLCQLVGVTDPRTYLTVVRLVFAACSLMSAAGTYLLARAYGSRRLSAASGAALCALLAPSIYFSTRAMGEVVSAMTVVTGFAVALHPAATSRRVIAGATLVGVSVFFRLQCGLFPIGLLAIFLGRRQYRQATVAFVTFGVAALVFGWIDHLTWSHAPGARFAGWFHSAVTYVQFTVIEGRASDWGTAPWQYYFETLLRAAPAAAVIAAILVVCATNSARGLLAVTMLFVFAHAATPHKELRFMLPAVPLLCALAGIGLDALTVPRVRLGATAALVIASLISVAGFHRLTFGDLGQYPGRAGDSAYDDSGSVNRLLLAARQRPSLCGLAVAGTPIAWTGGYSYLHRRVPLLAFDPEVVARGWVNHVIAPAVEPIAGDVVATDGAWVLRALPVARCTPPSPPFAWRV